MNHSVVDNLLNFHQAFSEKYYSPKKVLGFENPVIGHLDCGSNCHVSYPFIESKLPDLLRSTCPTCKKKVSCWISTNINPKKTKSLQKIQQIEKKHFKASEEKKNSEAIGSFFSRELFEKEFQDYKGQGNFTLLKEIFATWLDAVYERDKRIYALRKIDLENRTGYESTKKVPTLFKSIPKDYTFLQIKDCLDLPLENVDQDWKPVFLKSLENQSDFLTDLLKTHVHSKNDLDHIWNKLLKNLSLSKISIYFKTLFQNHSYNKDAQSTYLLLWLLKKSSSWKMDLPPFNQFQNLDLKEFLSESLEKSIERPVHFLSLIFTEVISMNYALLDFFPQKDFKKIADMAVEYLDKLDIELFGKAFTIYPRKEITSFWKNVQKHNNPNIRNILENIKKCLEESLPCKKSESVEELMNTKAFTPDELLANFRLIYPNFDNNYRRNTKTQTVKYGESIITVHNAQRCFKGTPVPDFLIRVDPKSKKLLWQIPLIADPKKPFENEVFVKKPYKIEFEEEKFAKVSFPSAKKSYRIVLSNGSLEEKKRENPPIKECSIM